MPNPTLACFASPVHPICLPRPRSRQSFVCICGMTTAVTILTLLLLFILFSPSGGSLASIIKYARSDFSLLFSIFYFGPFIHFPQKSLSLELSNRASARNSSLCGPALVVPLSVSALQDLGRQKILFSLGVGPRIATQVTESKL